MCMWERCRVQGSIKPNKIWWYPTCIITCIYSWFSISFYFFYFLCFFLLLISFCFCKPFFHRHKVIILHLPCNCLRTDGLLKFWFFLYYRYRGSASLLESLFTIQSKRKLLVLALYSKLGRLHCRQCWPWCLFCESISIMIMNQL